MSQNIDISKLLKILLCTSEKAATVARKTRLENSFLELLVQEKTGTDKNDRFLFDFKTLADVLIQETIRFDLEKEFHGLSERVFGEENNSFTNSLNETVHLYLAENEETTGNLLEHICNGNREAASLLASLAHSQVEGYMNNNIVMNFENFLSQKKDAGSSMPCECLIDDLAIWVDPIDSTFEYIHGNDCESTSIGLSYSGLSNVTVLIGAFHLSTGLPFLGVINQPFSKRNNDTKTYDSDVFWGYYHYTRNASGRRGSILCPALQMNSIQPILTETLVTSITDKEELQIIVNRSTHSQYEIKSVPGAGYKFLAVIQGLADAYILLKCNIFAWDTCGPHAILLSRGGGLLRLRPCLEAIKSNNNLVNDAAELIEKYQVTYKPWFDKTIFNSKDFSHIDGLLAYKDKRALLNVLEIFKSGYCDYCSPQEVDK